MSLLPQFGFVELMVIAIVALIVVGPKDLPKLMRSCGQMLSKARRMAGEFTSAFDDMAKESEIKQLRSDMEAMRLDNIASELKGEVDQAFKPISDEIDQSIKAGQEDSARTQTAMNEALMDEAGIEGGDLDEVAMDEVALGGGAMPDNSAAAPAPDTSALVTSGRATSGRATPQSN